jgi:uncharacterized protein (TIGR02300 family)
VPELGKKYTCYSCHTKFYDLGKAVPICPKCGADQRDAEDTPVVTSSRSRGAARSAPVVVEEPAEEDFAAESETETPAVESEDEEELVVEPEREEEPADEDESEEY